MKVSVKAIRQYGIRHTDLKIASIEPTDGYLALYGVGTTLEITLTNGDALRQPLMPVLYDARLVSMHDAKMLFAGIQRTPDKNAAQYFQEWSVTIVEV